MPSHQDRVRKSYAEVEIMDHYIIHQNEHLIIIKIIKIDIASFPSNRGLKDMIRKKIIEGIDEQYKYS